MKQANLNPVIKQVTKLLRKEHVDYAQAQYIFKEVRKALDLKAPKSRTGTVKRLSREETESFLQNAFNFSPATGLMMLTLYETGARVNELVNLKPEDLYISQEVIVIQKGKGEKRREVPVDMGLIRALSIHLNGRKQGYIFETNRHTKFTTRRVQQLVNQITEKAGITTHVTPHMFRHTKATDLAEKGITNDLIQQFLGHSKPETTMIYTRTANRDLKKAIKNSLISEVFSYS